RCFGDKVPDTAIVRGKLNHGAFGANFQSAVKLKKLIVYHHSPGLPLQPITKGGSMLDHYAVGFGPEHNGVTIADKLVYKSGIVPAYLARSLFGKSVKLNQRADTLKKAAGPVIKKILGQAVTRKGRHTPRDHARIKSVHLFHLTQ